MTSDITYEATIPETLSKFVVDETNDQLVPAEDRDPSVMVDSRLVNPKELIENDGLGLWTPSSGSGSRIMYFDGPRAQGGLQMGGDVGNRQPGRLGRGLEQLLVDDHETGRMKHPCSDTVQFPINTSQSVPTVVPSDLVRQVADGSVVVLQVEQGVLSVAGIIATTIYGKEDISEMVNAMTKQKLQALSNTEAAESEPRAPSS